MEKYTKWRDAGTGIHPFLPPKPKISNDESKFLLYLRKYLLHPLVIVIRFWSFPVVILWLMFTSAIGSIIPLAVVRRFWNRYSQMLGSRLLLLILGYWWIPAKYHKTRQASKIPSTWPPGINIKNGDVIISNHSSYVEILYLAYRYAPTFAILPKPTENQDESKNLVLPMNLVGALFHCWNPHNFIGLNEQKERFSPLNVVIERCSKSYGGPVVVFPEGVTTNNKLLLAPMNTLSYPLWNEVKPNIHIIGFKYEYELISPAYTVGSFRRHVISLASQVYNRMTVLYLTPDEIPSLPSPTSVSNNQSSDPAWEEWRNSIMTALGNTVRLRHAKLNSYDKLQFVQYWMEQNDKNEKKNK